MQHMLYALIYIATIDNKYMWAGERNFKKRLMWYVLSTFLCKRHFPVMFLNDGQYMQLMLKLTGKDWLVNGRW